MNAQEAVLSSNLAKLSTRAEKYVWVGMERKWDTVFGTTSERDFTDHITHWKGYERSGDLVNRAQYSFVVRFIFS